MNRWLLGLSALFLVTSAGLAQAWVPALAVPTCERPGLERFQLFWQRDRPAPYGDLEIRDILLQWPGVLRRLDRLELGLRGVPLPPYVPPLGVDPYLPRADPYLPPRDYGLPPRDYALPLRPEVCPRCPPVAPLAPRVDPYGPRVDPYVPREYLPPRDYLPRDYMPPAVANPLQGYQRYQGANAVRR